MVKPMVAKSSSAGNGGGGAEVEVNQYFHWNLHSIHGGLDDINVPRKQNQRAVDIFGTSKNNKNQILEEGVGHKWESDTICTGVVHGKDMVFELRENITKELPAVPREERLKSNVKNINVAPSPFLIRARWYMLRLDLWTLTLAYLGSFILMNVIFCGLFWIQDERCCDDSTLTFSQVFDFCIQTSTTIGYGGYVPHGIYANFLVVMLSYLAILLNTVFVGLLFAKFVTPIAKIDFSNVMTLSNINGLPCLQFRLGNADGLKNYLTDVQVRLTLTYLVTYNDERGDSHQFGITHDLKLLNDKRHHLAEIWTLSHVVDETSPLFGLDLPSSGVVSFRVSVSATQDVTKTPLTLQTAYFVEDVMIGHAFADQVEWDQQAKIVKCDYSKLSLTYPHPVWYPRVNS